MPIGEPAFVTEVMRALVAGDVSYIETTVTQLRDQPHAAWAALFYSCAPRFDYWLRHMPPHETVQHAAVFDHARGPQARVPLYVPYADFYQYQAGAGRLADRA